MTSHFSSLFLLLILNSSFYGQENIHTVTFLQDEKSTSVTQSSGSVLLDKKPFSIRYFAKQYDSENQNFYSAKIAVFTDPKDTLILKTGEKIENIPYLADGTGMAPYENNRYDTVFISNTGHHYLFYENEEERRVNLLSKNKKMLELQWTTFLDLPYKIQTSTIYFVILIDNNLNQTIDKDELKIVTVTF